MLTSAKGRIVERLFVHNLGAAGVLLLTAPAGPARVLSHLGKYTFAEVTELRDVSGSTFALSIVGPRWRGASTAAGIPELPGFGAASCVVNGVAVDVVATNGFDAEGVLVIGPRASTTEVEAALRAVVLSVGGAPMERADVETWRIVRGYPAAGHELTEEYNPLEAGLRDAVSFTKGCYVGQEVVARLNTYDKVSRALVRLRLADSAPVPERGAEVIAGGRPVGTVTSACRVPGLETVAAIASVKRRDLSDDATIAVAVAGEEWPAERVKP